MGATLTDLTPPTTAVAPGRCYSVQIPRSVKEFQAVVMVLEQALQNVPSAALTRNFVQKIAKDGDAEVCDANGDHRIDIDDIRFLQ